MAQVTILVGGTPVTVNETTPGLFGSLGYSYVGSTPSTTPSTTPSSTPSSTTTPTTSTSSSSSPSTYTPYTSLPSSSQSATNYTIKPGDTLSGIAAKYGTTVSALITANPSITDPHKIYAGNTIKIPTSTTTSAPAVLTSTYTPYSSISAAPTTTTTTTYTIKSGDTLSGIASKYGTTVQALMDANPNIKDKNTIYAGDTIKIPTATSATNQPVSGSSQQATTNQQINALQQQVDQLSNVLKEAAKLGITSGEIPPEIVSGMTAEDYLSTSEGLRK